MSYLHDEKTPFALRRADPAFGVLSEFLMKQANLSGDADVETIGMTGILIEAVMQAKGRGADTGASYLALLKKIEEEETVFTRQQFIPIVEYCAAYAIHEKIRGRADAVTKREMKTLLFCLRKEPSEKKRLAKKMNQHLWKICEARTWGEARYRLQTLDMLLEEKNIVLDGNAMFFTVGACLHYYHDKIVKNENNFPSFYLRSDLFPFAFTSSKIGAGELTSHSILNGNDFPDDDVFDETGLSDFIESSMEKIAFCPIDPKDVGKMERGVVEAFSQPDLTKKEFIPLIEYCGHRILEKKYEDAAMNKIAVTFKEAKSEMGLAPPENYFAWEMDRCVEDIMDAKDWDEAAEGVYAIAALFNDGKKIAARQAYAILAPCLRYYAHLHCVLR